MQTVHTGARKRRSLISRAGLRRAVTIGGTLVGATLVTAAFSMPAGATQDVPYNNVIIGTGSSTTYSMMQQLDDLYNSAPGCQIFIAFPTTSDPQPLDYSCTVAPTPADNPENPYNDVATEEPAFGSSNGIQALEDQGAHGATNPSGFTSSSDPIGNVAINENYARSSRALKSTDLKGLNFTAYAEDGVTAFNYTEVAGTATPGAVLNDLTLAQTQDVWNGTDTNWDQLCNPTPDPQGNAGACGANAPIVVFAPQEGSGTQSTWKTFLGFDPSAATNAVNCFTPSGGTHTCYGPGVIFENEDKQIATSAFVGTQKPFVGKTNPDWGGVAATNNDIKSDAMFIFSVGKYNLSCKTAGDCGGSSLGTGTTNQIFGLEGVFPTETTILDGQFPDDRYLYNVYSNGSNANIPVATAATLNYVSEIGFICNPNKGSATAIKDPNTGKTYLSEIQSTIEGAGFYPLSGGASSGTVNTTPIDEGPLTNPAFDIEKEAGGQGVGQPSTDPGFAQYQPYDTYATFGTGTDPSGFCLSTTTDANSGS